MEQIFENEIMEIYMLKLELAGSGHITNAYIIIDKKTRNCMFVDPSYDEKYIYDNLKMLNINLKFIYLTHCHGDHISALEGLYNLYNKDLKILIHENDKEGIFDDDKNCKYILTVPNFINLNLDNICTVKDGEIIKLGNVEIEVIHTPGHTDGSTILYIKDANLILTGDTVFSNCHGRTDLKSGSKEDMINSLNKVFDRFDSELIYPGHGLSSSIRDAKNTIYCNKGK